MEAFNSRVMVLETANDTIRSEMSKTTQKSVGSKDGNSGDFKGGDDCSQADDGKVIVVNNTIQAPLFNVYHSNCSMLQKDLIPVHCDSLNVMRNLICFLHGSHRNYKATTFHQYLYDECTGILAVTVNSTIIDDHHRHEVISAFCYNLNPEYNLAWKPLTVIITLCLNGQALNDLYMMWNRKLPNIASATVLSCTVFFVLLSSVVANSRNLNDVYMVLFGEARVTNTTGFYLMHHPIVGHNILKLHPGSALLHRLPRTLPAQSERTFNGQQEKNSNLLNPYFSSTNATDA